MPNLICSWSPDSAVTVDGSGFVTAVGAQSEATTSITLNGVSGACPTLVAAGPNSHQLFQVAHGQKWTMSGTPGGATGLAAFTVVIAMGTAVSATQVLFGGASNQFNAILLPAGPNAVQVRPAGWVATGAVNTTAPINRFLTPCIQVITYDSSVNQTMYGINNQIGATVTSSTSAGNMVLTQLFSQSTLTPSFAGVIGAIRIYDYVRNSTQLTQDFNDFFSWISTIFYVSSSMAGASDLSPSPWSQVTPYKTINQAMSQIGFAGQTIAPRGGDTFREDIDTARTGIVSGTQAAPITFDGGLWGTPIGNGLSNRPKAEIRHSSAPTLLRQGGAGNPVYSAGVIVPNASYPGDQAHRSPSFYMYYVPGGRIQFGAQYANGYPGTIVVPTMYAPWSCVCQDLPQYSSNVMAMTQVSYVQISKAASSTGSAGGLVRLTVDSTAEYATNSSVLVQDVGNTVINGTFTCTVVDAVTLDLQGTTFGPGGTVTATFTGSIVNLSVQGNPPPGKWGLDTAGVAGTVNTLYVNSGKTMSTGDIEVPFDEVTFAFKFRFMGDNWNINNVANAFFGVTGPYAGNTAFVCHQTWNNIESYFIGQDNFDIKSGAQVNINNSFVSYAGFGGNGIAGHDPAGTNVPPNGTGCVINVQNTVCVHNAQSNFGAEYTSRVTWNANVSVGEGIRHARFSLTSPDPPSSDGPGTCFVTNSIFFIPAGLLGTTDNANWGYPAAIIHQGAAAQMFVNNNTIVARQQYANPGNAVTGIWVEKAYAGPFLGAITAQNNILYNMTTAVNVAAGATITADHNGYMLNGAIGITTGPTDVLADPQFVNFPTNLHLLQTSKMASAGVPGLVTKDFENIPRRAPPALGAFDTIIGVVIQGGSSGPAYGRTYEPRVDDEEEAVLALLH